MSITDLIQKATNERLTSEDWQAIIAVCDAMNEASPADISAGFQALYKRLESPTGNAQMYGLTVLNALAQNGSTLVKTTIASSDTRKALSSVLRSNHKSVKDRAHDIIKDLTEALQDSEFDKWAKSGSTAATKSKQEIEDEEEQQIREAIRLSMQDQAPPQAAPPRAETPTDSNSEILASVHRSPTREASTPAITMVKTLYTYSSQTAGDLNFRAGETIQVVDSSHKDWWKGSLNGVIGVFPSNYVEVVKDEVIATEEDYIFAQAPNVERLLSIFASASQQPGYSIVGNPDLQAMYDEVMALRPQLIRMIDEYGARKQKLMKLNGDIVETRHRYEYLVNARMAPQPAGAHQFERQEPPRERLHPQAQAASAVPAAPAAPAVHAADADLRVSGVFGEPGRAASGYGHALHTPSAPQYGYPDPALAPSAPLASHLAVGLAPVGATTTGETPSADSETFIGSESPAHPTRLPYPV